MIGETYPFYSEEFDAQQDLLHFSFLSKGKANVPKIVAFSPTTIDGIQYYNMGLGDLVYDEGTGRYRIIDNRTTNNGDHKKVLYTVVLTLYKFFEIHPKATVRIVGSDSRRTEFYKKLALRHIKETKSHFDIIACVQNKFTAVEADSIIDYLLISRRKHFTFDH